jgi:hypothetical protein
MWLLLSRRRFSVESKGHLGGLGTLVIGPNDSSFGVILRRLGLGLGLGLGQGLD